MNHISLISNYQKIVADKNAIEIIQWAFNIFAGKKIAIASSFSIEDQVITDIALKANKDTTIFTLDTGRLPQETYDTIEATRKHYGINIEILFPETEAVKDMVNNKGPNLFYNSLEERKLCCNIRKVRPLKEKLKSLEAWICGLRREQSITRSSINAIEWDEGFSLVKINPLINWTEAETRKYIKQNNVPYNSLQDHGYPSLGCAPCTRAVKTGENLRSGRWWWENPEQKECGLHLQDGKLVKK